MDCTNSFVINSTQSALFTSTGGEFITWNVGTNRFWQVSTIFSSATDLNIQGFKNINIWGFDIVGDVTSNGLDAASIHDWRTNLSIIGQQPAIGNQILPYPNALNINTDINLINNYSLSRYKTKCELSSPIQSVTQIKFNSFEFDGTGNANLTGVNLRWKFTFVFYYTYEGE